MKLWHKLLIVSCLILLLIPSATACSDQSQTIEEQRQYYLRIAKDYDAKAAEAQNVSDEYWDKYLRYYNYYNIGGLSYYLTKAEDCKHKSEHYADLAREYRQQANYYRALAEQ